jgi:hypothetical protein
MSSGWHARRLSRGSKGTSDIKEVKKDSGAIWHGQATEAGKNRYRSRDRVRFEAAGRCQAPGCGRIWELVWDSLGQRPANGLGGRLVPAAPRAWPFPRRAAQLHFTNSS